MFIQRGVAWRLSAEQQKKLIARLDFNLSSRFFAGRPIEPAVLVGQGPRLAAATGVTLGL